MEIKILETDGCALKNLKLMYDVCCDEIQQQYLYIEQNDKRREEFQLILDKKRKDQANLLVAINLIMENQKEM